MHGGGRLDQLPGVHDLQVSGQSQRFVYRGDINALLRALSKETIQDLSVSEPDLEEIFLHDYTTGGDAT